MKNISLEKLYIKCGEETIPRTLFYKLKIEYTYIWINSPKFLCSLFIPYAKSRATKDIETKLQTTCFYLA